MPPSPDPLSGLPALLDVRGAAIHRLEAGVGGTKAHGTKADGTKAGGTWSLGFPARPRLKVNAVLRGRCWLTPEHGPPQPLVAGDAFLLAHAAGFRLSGDPGPPTRAGAREDGSALFEAAPDGTVRLGGHGDTVLVGGSFTLANRGGGPLLDALPAFLHLGAADPRAGGVRAILTRLEAELRTPRMGGTLVVQHLADLALIDLLRAGTEAQTAGGAPGPWAPGWLAGLRDPGIAAALAALHAEPGRPWTLEGLARLAGRSRSGFAQRFRALTGTTPLDHLADWRMALARAALRRQDPSLARIADRLGYRSVSAFTAAFRRRHGCSPRRWPVRPDEHEPA